MIYIYFVTSQKDGAAGNMMMMTGQPTFQLQVNITDL